MCELMYDVGECNEDSARDIAPPHILHSSHSQYQNSDTLQDYNSQNTSEFHCY